MEINVQFNNTDEMLAFAIRLSPLASKTAQAVPKAAAEAVNAAAAVKSSAKKEPAQKAAEPAEVKPAAKAASTPVAAPTPEPAAKPAHTAAELREILFNLNHEANPDGQPMTINKAKDVINALGYASFKDVPEEKYDELYTAVDKAMKELDHAG